MNVKSTGFLSESGDKLKASRLSTKNLIELLERALHLPPAEVPGGSMESWQSYFRMIRQFAAMANSYQNLIPAECHVSSILQLASFLLDLNMEEFKRISGNLWPMLGSADLSDEMDSSADATEISAWESIIGRFAEKLPDEIDLTEGSQDDRLEKTAVDLMDAFSSISELQALDRWVTARQKARKNAFYLTLKMALSRMLIRQLNTSTHISLIVALYNEHNRIFPKRKGNPNGEDFIRRKVRQLTWLFSGTPITFDLLFVDDGCPNQSGEKARQIIAAEGIANAKVLFLIEAIEKQLPVIRGLHTTDESRKGGAIQYGMWQSLLDQEGRDSAHVIVYTDADMAAPVHQLGLLLAGLDEKNRVAIGSRYDIGSVCRGPWGPNGEVQGLTEFDRLMVGLRGLFFSRLFPQTGLITDTQCALKAFGADLLNRIILKTTIRTFSFDVEFLVLSAAAGSSIAVAPIYWHDSAAESNFWRSGSNSSDTAD
jgi:hypothetical protein